MLGRVTVAFLLGLFLGSYLPFFPFCTAGLLFSAAIACTLLERRGRLSMTRSLALYGALLAGVLYWSLYIGLVSDSSVLARAGTGPATVNGVVIEPLRQGPGRLVLTVSVRHLGTDHQPVDARGQVRVTWRGPDAPVRQGDLVTFSAKLRPPAGSLNPGGFDFATYLRNQGIDAVASVSGPGGVRVLASPRGPSRWVLWHVMDECRDLIRRAAEQSLTGPALGIFLGIIIGEPGYLDPDERDAFMATGTVHILSISGSHLGLIAFLTFVLVRGLCRRMPVLWLERLSRRITPTRLAVLATLVMVTFYCLLAGAAVATVRSWVMILVFLLAVWSGRHQHLLLALAGAAVLIVGHDPRALYDISFQLSFVSVLAIALVLQGNPVLWAPGSPQAEEAEPRIDWVARLRDWLRDYFLITGAVTLATVPLVAYYFNQVPWLGVVANLLVVPLAGLVLVPLGLAAAGWLLLVGGDALPGGPYHQAVLDAFSWLVHVFASVPGAAWHVASPPMLSIALFYGCVCLWWWPKVAASVRAGCLVVVVLLVGWWAWSPRPAWDGTTLRVTFLDVGQGDASLIELPDGQTVLIDGGASYDTLDMGRAVVGPFLWDRGIRRLDHVIGTHPQLDHVGGLAWIVRKFEVGRYWSNGVRREEPFYQRLARALDERRISERVAITGDEIAASGPCRLHVLNPDRAAAEPASRSAEAGSAMNNLSVVTRLDCGPHSVLFTADVETGVLGRLSRGTAPIEARVLKVPHHGARSSLDRTWVARVRPEVAVFSAGRYNAYGHPAPTVVHAYEEIGTRIFRTDRQGAVWLTARLNESALDLHSAAESVLLPVRIWAGAAEQERGNVERLARLWAGS